MVLLVLNIAATVAGKDKDTPADKPVEPPPVRILDIRKTTGPWEAIMKAPEGGYLRIDQSGQFTALPPERDATSFAALDAFPPRQAAILLISLEEVAKTNDLVGEQMRVLEIALEYPKKRSLKFDGPKHPWGLGNEEGFYAGNEWLISFLTTEAELAEKLRSDDIEARRLALSAFRNIRRSISNRYFVQAAMDDDEELRTSAIKELEKGGDKARAVITKALKSSGGDHEKLAALLMHLDYRAATRQDTDKAYAKFLEQHPASKFDAEMRYRMLSSRKDAAGLKRLLASNPVSATVRDIFDLIEEGKVTVSVSGIGIDKIYVRVQKLTPEILQFRVPLGTYFVAERSSSQNMISTEDETGVLIGDGGQLYEISVACANQEKTVPTRSDKFSLLRPAAVPQADLAVLMPVLEKANVAFPIRQAAVWIITNNVSYNSLGILAQRACGAPICGSTRLIKEAETVAAMEIVDKAGIDVTRKRIWESRSDLLAKLSDDRQIAWLKAKLAQKQ